MSALEKLRACQSLRDLAPLLNFTPAGLAYVLYKLPEESKYTTFTISKKAGGVRTINAPAPQLKLAQARLAQLLYDCLDELEKGAPWRKAVSHGFHRERSALTNAKPHRKRRYVLNLDLEDFFGTINFGRVRGYFLSDASFKLSPSIATVIAQIACFDNRLPQGAPSSPVISNLIGRILDVRLARLAKAHDCRYTRYADDITFSTHLRTFPPQLAKPVKAAPHRWRLMKALRREITDAGFKINASKTRMQIRGSRQEATGLVINEKINVAQEYYRSTRSMCHALFRTGEYHIPSGPLDEHGTPKRVRSLAPLAGRFAHIHHVKARRDRTPAHNKSLDFKPPGGMIKLYKRFLYFAHFMANERPIIVTEGKSDIIYLQRALRALHADGSKLTVQTKDRISLALGFVRPSHINTSVLGLPGGTGVLRELVANYHRSALKYPHRPLTAPVIVLVDNDDGSKDVLQAASKITGSTIQHDTAQTWFHLSDNLYLVKTPHIAGKKKTCIEDLFPAPLLETKIDGKPFDPNKAHGDETAYGKAVFASNVVLEHATPGDFAGFAPLAQALEAVLEDYEKRKAAEAAPAVAIASSGGGA